MFGVTPDISELLLFTFNEWIYYLEAEISFPGSKEKAGHFVEIAENVGDALTFWILTEDPEQVIARSVTRTAEYPKTVNQRLNQLQPTIQEHNETIVGMKDLITNATLPSIDPEQLIGYEFTVEHAGNLQKAKRTEQADDKTYHVEYA